MSLFTGQFLGTINISHSEHLNRTAVNSIYIRLVLRPKEEVKGPGFGHSNMLFFKAGVYQWEDINDAFTVTWLIV